MSFFSSKPCNRRRRRTSRKSDSSWIDEQENSAPKSARRQKAVHPREKVHQLHAQIGVIESFLNKHHEAEVSRLEMKQQNILPPPDRSAHRDAKRGMSHAARRRYLAERNRNSFRFLLLFCTACALSWWLIFSGV